MDHGGSTKVFFAAALFVAAFVATLLLSISTTEESRNEPVAAESVTATPTGAIALQSLTPLEVEMPADDLLAPEDLEDRIWAITELATAPSPTSVDALAHVLATSDDYRERLEAVEALHRIADSGESSAAARQALQQATTDRHAEVAARARALPARD